MSARGVVYTCITGGYDDLRQLQPADPGELDYVYFSERRYRSAPPGWTFRPFASPPRVRRGHDINRYHKFFPHHVLPEYRASIYLDGNILVAGELPRMIDAVLGRSLALAAFRHPHHATVEAEIDACLRFRKIKVHDRPIVERQLATYRERGYAFDRVLTTNFVLVRDAAHPALAPAMSIWWSQLFEHSPRDQFSLGYALWAAGAPWEHLDALGFPVELATSRRHRKTLRRRLRKLGRKIKKLFGQRPVQTSGGGDLSAAGAP